MPSEAMKKAIPEEVGVSSRALLELLRAIERDKPAAIHGMQILRHGRLVLNATWKPYEPNRERTLFSLTKSLTSLAVGMLVDEGKLSLDERVVDIFPEEAARCRLDPRMGQMTVRHLLTMTSGFPENISGCGIWSQRHWHDLRAFLELPLVYAPGVKFVYNSGSAHMSSMIVTRRAGKNATEYLRDRLFAPLGIEDAVWDEDNLGNNTGGWGASLSLNDMARLGQLMLNGGEWDGRRVVSREYLAEATAPRQRVRPGDVGATHYGYYMWVDPETSYAMNGAFGQLVVVYPRLDCVIALQMANSDGVPNRTDALVYGTQDGGAGYFDRWLFPGFTDAPQVADPRALAELEALLEGLDLDASPYGESAVEAGHGDRLYEMVENTQRMGYIRLTFGEDTVTYTQEDDLGAHSIVCGKGRWVAGQTTMSGKQLHHNREFSPMEVSGRAHWADAETLVLRWAFRQMPFVDTVRIRFVGEKILVYRSVNISTPNTNNGYVSLPTVWGSRAL